MLARLVPDIQKTAELVEEITAACREQDVGAGPDQPGDPAARQGDPAERRRVRAGVGDLRGAGRPGRAAAGHHRLLPARRRRRHAAAAGRVDQRGEAAARQGRGHVGRRRAARSRPPGRRPARRSPMAASPSTWTMAATSTTPTSSAPDPTATSRLRSPAEPHGSPDSPDRGAAMADTAQYLTLGLDQRALRHRYPQCPRDPRHAADLEAAARAGLPARHDRCARRRLSDRRPAHQARPARRRSRPTRPGSSSSTCPSTAALIGVGFVADRVFEVTGARRATRSRPPPMSAGAGNRPTSPASAARATPSS